MSSVVIAGDTSGTVTLDAPAVAGSTVITLPASGGSLFTQGNILGTVSESSGVPTGAIIERGSNANGEFVRYADGTMICRIQNPLLDHTGSLSSSTRLYGTWLYPSTFIEPPQTSMDCGVDNGANFIGCNRANVINWGTNTATTSLTSRNFSIFFSSGVSTTNARVENVNLIAIGRWF